MEKKVDKNGLTKKEAHRLNILEYLANPENEVIPRVKLARDVCGVSPQALYKLFSGDEMCELERQAIDMRRRRYSLRMGQVDSAMIKKAIDGSEKAAELCYKRFENWNPNKPVEVDIDGGEQTVKLTFEVVDGRKGN